MNTLTKLKPNHKKIIKLGLFVCLLLLTVYYTMRKFTLDDNISFQNWKSFYSEKTDSLDAVYIGASNVYAFWAAPASWNEYGNAVHPISVSALPATAVKYYIMEARKTQKDALYIVNLNDFRITENFSIKMAHWAVDNMAMSNTRLKLINALYSKMDAEEFSKAELYFPFIRFHSRWSELKTNEIIRSINGLKGASIYSSIFSNTVNICNSIRETDKRVKLSDSQNEVLNDLLDYCESEKINVLFVFAPQAINNEDVIGQFNSIQDMVELRGFKCLNLITEFDEIGLQPEQDYADDKHVNIHGALKYTAYLGKYLKENYGFEDKRGVKEYTSWDESYEKYKSIIQAHVLDFELEHSDRDYSLKTPKIIECAPVNQGVQLRWTVDEACDRYDIYKFNNAKRKWECIAVVSVEEAGIYHDTNITLLSENLYHIVPVKEGEHGESVYGNYEYNPIGATLYLETPEITSLDETVDGVKISWSSVDNADGYCVFRKEADQEWTVVANVGMGANYYIDKNVEGKQYSYTICGYLNGEDGEKILGPRNEPGISRETIDDVPVLYVDPFNKISNKTADKRNTDYSLCYIKAVDNTGMPLDLLEMR